MSYPRMRVSRAKIPYFGGALRVGKAELFILDARFRKDDGRRGVAVRDNLSRTVVPPLSSPLGLARGSRAKSPYFGDVLTSPKSGISFFWIQSIRKHDGRRRRQGQWVFSQAGTSRISKKRNCLSWIQSFRKDDHRRGVVGGDNIPHSVIKTTC